MKEKRRLYRRADWIVHFSQFLCPSVLALTHLRRATIKAETRYDGHTTGYHPMLLVYLPYYQQQRHKAVLCCNEVTKISFTSKSWSLIWTVKYHSTRTTSHLTAVVITRITSCNTERKTAFVQTENIRPSCNSHNKQPLSAYTALTGRSL